jgi:hypothetical protein
MALVLAGVQLFAGKMRFLEGIPPEPVAVDCGWDFRFTISRIHLV